MRKVKTKRKKGLRGNYPISPTLFPASSLPNRACEQSCGYCRSILVVQLVGQLAVQQASPSWLRQGLDGLLLEAL